MFICGGKKESQKLDSMQDICIYLKVCLSDAAFGGEKIVLNPGAF